MPATSTIRSSPSAYQSIDWLLAIGAGVCLWLSELRRSSYKFIRCHPYHRVRRELPTTGGIASRATTLAPVEARATVGSLATVGARPQTAQTWATVGQAWELRLGVEENGAGGHPRMSITASIQSGRQPLEL